MTVKKEEVSGIPRLSALASRGIVETMSTGTQLWMGLDLYSSRQRYWLLTVQPASTVCVDGRETSYLGNADKINRAELCDHLF